MAKARATLTAAITTKTAAATATKTAATTADGLAARLFVKMILPKNQDED